MRTTIDIPDELFRQAKARAALRGVRLRDIVERGLRLALQETGEEAPARATLPLHRSASPGALKVGDALRAEAAALGEEDAAHARPLRR